MANGVTRHLATAAAVLLLAVTAAAGTARAADPIVMKIGTNVSNDVNHAYCNEVARLINERSAGRMKAEVFPGGQLGDIPQLIQGTQLGTIQLFVQPPGFLKGVHPGFQVTDAAGLFDSIDHAFATVTDPRFRTPFLDLGREKNLTGVSVFIYGPTSYASTVPLRTLADFKGKKFRVLASKFETTLMQKLGATGVPMPFLDALPALQQRAIDGVRSSWVVMGSMKFHTVAKFVTPVDDAMILLAAFVNKPWYEGLPPDLRQMVTQVGLDAQAHMLGVSKEFEANSEKNWKANGTEVIRLSPSEKAEFMTRARAASDEVIGADPELNRLYKLLTEVAQSHRS
ncbi:MAG: TRAP transporter substrate-binding protein [Rhodospirillales bacterium]